MRYTIITFTFLLLISCNRTKSNQQAFETILETDSLQTQLYKSLNGTWSGYYECLKFSVDTTFYASSQETLEYLLTNTVSDSSLVKEVTLNQNTIKRPLFLTFNIEDEYSEHNDVIVKTAETERVFPFSTRFSILEYKNSDRTLHFGEDEGGQRTFMSLPDGTMISNVLNDSLSWDNIDLVIESITDDSAIFKFETGIGKLVLKKDR